VEQYTQTQIEDDDKPDSAAAMSEAPAQQLPLAGVVIKLLDRATAAIDADRAVAKYYIARATALLQANRDSADRVCRGGTAKLSRGGLSSWQARLVTRHIDVALASTIRTDECAAIAKLSNSHFRRAFKESFGTTFYSYVSRRRVERAQELMVMTDRPLHEIASRCGFADQSHFIRVFRRLVGPSPADWRRL
jgi:AraC family transcriptional regulator